MASGGHSSSRCAASLVVEHRLQTHRLSSCCPRTQLPHGMWDPPRPGLEPVSPALAGRLSTTAPPGKPCPYTFVPTGRRSEQSPQTGHSGLLFQDRPGCPHTAISPYCRSLMVGWSLEYKQTSQGPPLNWLSSLELTETGHPHPLGYGGYFLTGFLLWGK